MATSPCSSTEQDEPVEISDNVIAEFQAWSVFIETGPEQCFVGADPLETIIEPALAEESLCRGAMGLTVGYWPETGENASGILHQVSGEIILSQMG